MNIQKFEEIGLIKYAGYFFCYAVIYSIARAVTKQGTTLLGTIVFLTFAWSGMMLLAYEYRKEQKQFDNYYSWPILSHMGIVIVLALLITACRIGFDYLQSSWYIDYLNIGKIYLDHETKSNFVFIVIAFGVVLPFLQVYLADGFFFDYLFRWQTKESAVIGIFTSALVFAILSLEFQPIWFLLNFFVGIILAWSFLRSQALWLPLFLAVINGLLMMISLK